MDFKEKVEEYKTKSSGFYERNKLIVPDCIAGDEGEVPVKQFNVAILRSRALFQKAEAKIQVTNKRLIFRATGFSLYGKISAQNEFAIDKIGGLEHAINYRFSLTNFILCLIAVILPMFLFGNALLNIYVQGEAIGTFAIVVSAIIALIIFGYLFSIIDGLRSYYFYKLLPLGILMGSAFAIYTIFENNMFALGTSAVFALITGFFCFLFSFNKNLKFKIFTEGASQTVEVVYDAVGLIRMILALLGISIGTEKFLNFSEVLPTKETDRAFRELGAIISDIQKLGDYGIEKWKNK